MRSNLAQIALFVITLLFIRQNLAGVCEGTNKLKVACDCGNTGSDNCGTNEEGKWCIEGTCYEEIHLRYLDNGSPGASDGSPSAPDTADSTQETSSPDEESPVDSSGFIIRI